MTKCEICGKEDTTFGKCKICSKLLCQNCTHLFYKGICSECIEIGKKFFDIYNELAEKNKMINESYIRDIKENEIQWKEHMLKYFCEKEKEIKYEM